MDDKKFTENGLEVKEDKKKKRGVITAIAIILIIILLLLMRSCAGGPSKAPDDHEVIGNFTETDTQQTVEKEEKKEEEIPSITFAGYGQRTVSKDDRTIELRNPENNFVDMVFTVTDEATGEVIAKTNKVEAGKYVYVDMMDFYKTPGTYQVDIDISTTDHETGEGMNGLHQDVELTVK